MIPVGKRSDGSREERSGGELVEDARRDVTEALGGPREAHRRSQGPDLDEGRTDEHASV